MRHSSDPKSPLNLATPTFDAEIFITYIKIMRHCYSLPLFSESQNETTEKAVLLLVCYCLSHHWKTPKASRRKPMLEYEL
jgi:hypothetical protein